jgi:hypothetical protein
LNGKKDGWAYWSAKHYANYFKGLPNVKSFATAVRLAELDEIEKVVEEMLCVYSSAEITA